MDPHLADHRAFTAPSTPAAFALSVGQLADGELEVVSFRGREALSKPFSFEVLAETTLDPAAWEAEILGQRASLAFNAAHGTRRTVHGIIAAVSVAGGAPDHGTTGIRVRLVPRLWLLRRRRNNRIFQGLTVPEIVAAVLSEVRVPFDFRLRRKVQPKSYCVQYQETDYELVTRLVAEEGIFFYFEQTREGEITVFSDDCHYPPIGGHPRRGDGDPVLVMRPGDDARDDESVESFTHAHRVEPRTVLLRDFDFRRPMLDLAASAAVAGPPSRSGPAPREVDTTSLAFYEPTGDYEEPEVGDDRAGRLLEQLRRRAKVGRGVSGSRLLEPGHRFALLDHHVEELNRAYVITRVDHEGHVPEKSSGVVHDAGRRLYRNEFECVPAEVPYRPRRPARRPCQVVETAIVVGPIGEEIHTDALGRIKVHFHWDREGARNEHSSCWLRVSQAWAGAAWGMQHIPRVGMEVLVSFIGGDTDRPIVVGCLYNGSHPPPFLLPAEQTRSGIRTRSTPGGHGHNELSFEDAAGREQVRLRAERDLEEHVGRDRRSLVRGEDLSRVNGLRRAEIEADDHESVGGDQRLSVAGSRVARVEGDAHEVVRGNRDVDVDGDTGARVGGAARAFIAGASELRVEGDHHIEARGHAITRVGRADGKRSFVLHVEGTTAMSGTGPTEISAEQGIVLRCGKSRIHLTPDRVEIIAPTVVVSGEGSSLSLGEGAIRARADDTVRIAGQTTHLTGSSSSVLLSGDLDLQGQKVRIKGPSSPDAPPEEGPTETTTLSLVDQNGAPLAHQRFVVRGADGSERGGILDKDGKAQLSLEESATIVFPDLDAEEA